MMLCLMYTLIKLQMHHEMQHTLSVFRKQRSCLLLLDALQLCHVPLLLLHFQLLGFSSGALSCSLPLHLQIHSSIAGVVRQRNRHATSACQLHVSCLVVACSSSSDSSYLLNLCLLLGFDIADVSCALWLRMCAYTFSSAWMPYQACDSTNTFER